MKKLLVLLMAVLLVFSALPASTFAIAKDDKKFQEFLVEINWTQEDYINYLEKKDWLLEDFSSIDELGTPITEKSIEELLTTLKLTRTELNALFIENGDIEEGEDILDGTYLIFMEDIELFADFYLNGGIDEDDADFLKFLESINWSKEDYLAYLDSKGWSLKDFWYLEELGTPLSEENVKAVLLDFDLTREELNTLLVEFYDIEEGQDVLEGTSIIFEEDLRYFVESYLTYEEIDMDDLEIFTEIGLTDEELEALLEHFMSLDLEDENFLTQLELLAERMEAIENFESADDLDAAQITEILDIFADMMNLFQIDAKYYLTNGTEKQPMTLSSLMAIETTNDMDLLIEIYNTQGTFLADMIFTAEMFGSEIIKETGKDLEVVKEVVTAPKKEVVKKETKAVKTVKGGKLPKTATDYVSNTLVGLAFVLIGFLLFRRMKTASN
ncbi:processed acidic surface protein [Planomicrobium okeanokoites]|uniref:processed acidic surface protein n=1 Tax=Planomicrobium okeanokoites TaxID=244 RepID=UPI0035663AA2